MDMFFFLMPGRCRQFGRVQKGRQERCRGQVCSSRREGGNVWSWIGNSAYLKKIRGHWGFSTSEINPSISHKMLLSLKKNKGLNLLPSLYLEAVSSSISWCQRYLEGWNLISFSRTGTWSATRSTWPTSRCPASATSTLAYNLGSCSTSTPHPTSTSTTTTGDSSRCKILLVEIIFGQLKKLTLFGLWPKANGLF